MALTRSRSDLQRRAMFAQLGQHQRSFRRRVHKRVEGTSSAALAAAAGTAGVASVLPHVTHLPGFETTRQAARAPWQYIKTLGKQFPHMGTYAAIPAAVVAGTLAYQKWKHPRRKLTKGDVARKVGLAGGVGLGGWLAERSIIHSLPALMNEPFVGRPMTRKLRAELVLGHGLPLAAAATGIGVLAHRIARKHGEARQTDAGRNIRRAAMIGAPLLLASWYGGDQLMKRGILKPSHVWRNIPTPWGKKVFDLRRHGLEMSAVPAYLGYRMARHLGDRRRRRQGGQH